MSVTTDFEVPGAGDDGKFPVYDATSDSFLLRNTNVVYVNVDGGATTGTAVAASAAIQAVVDGITGPSVVQLGPGYFGISTRIDLPHNVVIRGAGRGVTILYATADVGIIAGPATSLAGSLLAVEDLTIWGYADRNPTLGLDEHRAIDLNKADYIWVQNVHVRYSRQMSITGIGEVEARVNNCVVEKSHRDGINVTQSDKAIILNNTLMQIGDDGIAYHAPNGLSGAIRSHSAVIVGNRLYKSAGIKVLGATNVTVTGNSGRFLNGYGVYVDGDAAAGEGNKDPLCLVVTGNTFVDIIDLAYYGSGDNQFGMMISAYGPDTGALGGYPALVGPGSGTAAAIVPNNQAWNKVIAGGVTSGTEHTGAYGVLVDGNTCMQTLESTGVALFSDFGFGQMWWTAGSVDFTFLGNIWKDNAVGGTSQALRMTGGMLRDVMVCNNKFYGFRRNVDIEYIPVAAQGRWVNNTFTRSENAFHAVSSSSFTHADFWFEGNDIDLDPLFESSTRTLASGQPTGAWTAPGNEATVAYFNGLSGLHLVRNRVKNASKIVNGTAVRMDANTLYIDAAVSGGQGGVVASDSELAKSVVVQYVADPRLATYGQIKDGYDLSDTAMPASGSWCKSTFVANETPTVSSNRVVLGWLRLTTGTGNVSGTDWSEVATFASGQLLKGTQAAYNPASTADDAEATATTVTVTGAAVGDTVLSVGMSTAAELWDYRATVTSANTVTVQLVNRSGGTVDLAAGTLTVWVLKA